MPRHNDECVSAATNGTVHEQDGCWCHGAAATRRAAQHVNVPHVTRRSQQVREAEAHAAANVAGAHGDSAPPPQRTLTAQVTAEVLGALAEWVRSTDDETAALKERIGTLEAKNRTLAERIVRATQAAQSMLRECGAPDKRGYVQVNQECPVHYRRDLPTPAMT